MNPWSWLKRKTVGETVRDFGEVLKWTEGWVTNRLHLKLTRDGEAFFLFVRTSTTTGLSKGVRFSRIRVTTLDLEGVCRVVLEARDTIMKLLDERRTASGEAGPRG